MWLNLFVSGSGLSKKIKNAIIPGKMPYLAYFVRLGFVNLRIIAAEPYNGV